MRFAPAFALLSLGFGCAPKTHSPVARVATTAATNRVVAAARAQIGVSTEYSPAYLALKYPGGDPPIHTGVCTDVVIRALRRNGLDLQRAVHEDMVKNFARYPHLSGSTAPDSNIDHRRVPILQAWFGRKGWSRSVQSAPQPGDIVAWRLPSNRLHVGIVSDQVGSSGDLTVIHNIGAGVQDEDRLREWPIIGLYRVPQP